MHSFAQLVRKEKTLFSNAGWLFLLQVLNVLLPFVTVPYVTRVFGAERYGIFSIALNHVTYFQLIVEYGFNLSATKKIVNCKSREEHCDLVSSVVSARIILVLICYLVLIGMGVFGAVSDKQLQCATVLFTMLIGIAIQLNWLFQGLQEMKVITIATAIARGLSVILILLLIKDSNQLNLYAFLYSITFLCSGILTHYYAFKQHKIRFHLPDWRQIVCELKDGMPIFLSSAAGKAIGNIGVTVLGLYESAAIVGAYSAVLKLPLMASLMFAPISQALYPRINEVRNASNQAAVKLVAKVGTVVVVLFGMGLLLMTAIRVPLVRLLFGDEYLIAVDTLIPLSVWVLFGIVNNFLGVQLLIPFGCQSLYSALMLIDCVFALLLNSLFGLLWGAIGVAIAVAVSEVILTTMLLIALFKVLKLDSTESTGV